MLCLSGYSFGLTCPVAPAVAPSAAEQAYLAGDYDGAEKLYRQTLAQKPNDAEMTAALVELLLRQQRVADASALATSAVAANPGSVALQTAMGEVQYREGEPWLAGDSADTALKLDSCYPRQHLLRARLYWLSYMNATAVHEIETAHALDPNDPDITDFWMGVLPLREHVAALEQWLASPNGETTGQRQNSRGYLVRLKKTLETPPPPAPCSLTSAVSRTELPFIEIMHNTTQIRGFGFEVKLNERRARLLFSTNQVGLLVSRSVAEKAGLKPRGDDAPSGFKGAKLFYPAFAEKIIIGGLEFHNCVVNVADERNILDGDGLIGPSMLARFLVILDFPMRKLLLEPLPPRPGMGTEPMALATVSSTGHEAEEKIGAESAKETTSAPSQGRVIGPQDRYIAPEMKDWTKLYHRDWELMIPVALNGGPKRLFTLSTGWYTTVIGLEAAKEVTKAHIDTRSHVNTVAGKVQQVFSADNVALSFANIAQKGDDVVSFDLEPNSMRSGLEVSGYLGITTLAQLRIQMDYRDGLVKFDYDPHRGFASRPLR